MMPVIVAILMLGMIAGFHYQEDELLKLRKRIEELEKKQDEKH